MARKVDLSGVKSFFLEKGEKVGMFACLGAAALLVGFAVYNGLQAKTVGNTDKTWSQAIADAARAAEQKRDVGEQVPPLGTIEVKSWDDVRPSFPWKRLVEQSDRTNNKRTNPKALAPLADPEGKYVDMKYIAGTYYAYDVNQQFKTATVRDDPAKAAKEAQPAFKFNPFAPKQPQNVKQKDQLPLITVQPMRMVVVNTVFPLTAQLTEFRKAFRMMNDFELFQSKDLPKFLGINVMKTEVIPGKAANWTPLVAFDPQADKLLVDPAIMSMYRQGLFDDTVSPIMHTMMQGMVMPLPMRAGIPPHNVYPPVQLPGLVTLDENMEVNPDVAMPGMKMPMANPGAGGAGAAGEAPKVVNISWAKLPPELREKLSDGFYPLDPAGIHPEADDKAAVFPGMPTFGGPATSVFKGASPYSATAFWSKYPTPPPPPPMPGAANVPNPAPMPVPNPMAMTKPYEALIRFIDPDVKPGKTYKYSIQVRIANPNYGKKTEVAFAALADMKELLPAPPVETPTITIPDEYHLYAVDQKPDNPEIRNGSDDKDAKGDEVAIQIHRWVGVTGERDLDTEAVIGDWAIAERLLVHRGDTIGRIVNIETPVWNKFTQTYEIPRRTGAIVLPPAKKGPGGVPGFGVRQPAGGQNTDVVGVPVDFTRTPPAVLIDFDGGKRSQKFEGSTVSVKDESASNLLILRADGKLIVRNTRADSDPDAPEYTERQQRVDAWKEKARMFRAATPAGGRPGAPKQKDNNFFLQPRE